MYLSLYLASCLAVYYASVYKDREKLRGMREYERDMDAPARVYGSIFWPCVVAFVVLALTVYALTRPFAWVQDRIERSP